MSTIVDMICLRDKSSADIDRGAILPMLLTHMQTAPNRQALRSRATHAQIVQSALTVFALKGYGMTSMDDVCLAAGCSKGGLYHHFPTKQSVLKAVVQRLVDSGELLPPFESSQAGGGLQP